MDTQADQVDPPVLRIIEPGEIVEVLTEASGAHLLLTNRRLAVASGERVALDIAFPRLRRIQFDIERQRPATLVIVPEDPMQEPQVLAIPPSRYREVTAMLAVVGRRIVDDEGS